MSATCSVCYSPPVAPVGRKVALAMPNVHKLGEAKFVVK